MNRERRAVLRGVAALTGVAVGSGTGVAVGSETGIAVGSDTGIADERDAEGAVGTGTESTAGRVRQQVAADLQPGVTLFDLDGDGEYAVAVERADEEVRDDDHPQAVHVTSGGRSTVDYAVTAVEPPAETTLGGLGELSYDYRGGTADGTPEGENGTTATAGTGEANAGAASATASLAPGQPFVVVENDDGRHGAYFTPADPAPADDQWRTFDVLDRLTGGGADGGAGGGATGGRWFEYTGIEAGYDGESFRDAVSRFGADARLALVGVGHGDAVAPTVLDAYYGNLVVGGETLEFPVEVVNRVS